MPGIFTMEFGAIDNAVLHRLLMVFADLDGTPTLTVSWDGAQVGTSTANLPGNAGQDYDLALQSTQVMLQVLGRSYPSEDVFGVAP